MKSSSVCASDSVISSHNINEYDRRPLYAWYVVLVLLITYVVSFSDRMILNLLVGEIKTDLEITDIQISLLQGVAFAVCFLLAGIPFGRCADLFNRRNIIIIGVVLWSIATISCGLAETFLALFLARMFVGIGEAALTPAAYSMLTDYFNKEKLGRALSIYSSGIWVGAGLALIVGGAVLNSVADAESVLIPGFGTFNAWQIAFFVVGFPGFLVALLLLTVREPERHSLNISCSSVEEENNKVSFMQVMLFINKNRRFFVAHYGGFALFTLLAQAILAWSPELLIRIHGVHPSVAGTWLGVLYLIFSVAGIYIGGVISDHFMSKGVVAASMSVGGVATLALVPFTIFFALAPGFYEAIIFGVAMAFAISMPLGVAANAIQIVSPIRMRGQLSALYVFMVGIVGICLGPASVAILTEFVFADEKSIAKSLSIVAIVVGPLGGVLLLSGVNPMKAMVLGDNR